MYICRNYWLYQYSCKCFFQHYYIFPSNALICLNNVYHHLSCYVLDLAITITRTLCCAQFKHLILQLSVCCSSLSVLHWFLQFFNFREPPISKTTVPTIPLQVCTRFALFRTFFDNSQSSCLWVTHSHIFTRFLRGDL